jgi:hypothetical protein
VLHLPHPRGLGLRRPGQNSGIFFQEIAHTRGQCYDLCQFSTKNGHFS